MEWQISDQDIQAVEELLLPHGAHFPEDARKVIRWWHSTDVAACPGSGKTTVLLAKLKLLADKMPLENGAGICVLSHTNVAVNEIKNRLSDYADRLLNYPNYIGTIQSFIDRFVTMPYLRNISGQNVQVVDGLTYCLHHRGQFRQQLPTAPISGGILRNFRLRYSGIDKKEHEKPYMMAFVHFSWRERNPTKRNKTRAVHQHCPLSSIIPSLKILEINFKSTLFPHSTYKHTNKKCCVLTDYPPQQCEARNAKVNEIQSM